MSSMTMKEYQVLCTERSAKTKALFLAALGGHLPDGYRLSDDPGQMYANALVRLKPVRPAEGDRTFSLLHSISYRGSWVDSEYHVTPSIEKITVVCDIHAGTGLLDSCREFGEDGAMRVTVQFDDLAATVLLLVAGMMAEAPFTRFEWRPYEHDPKSTFELCNRGVRVAKIWKSGSVWGTLTGNLTKTKAEAVRIAEDAEQQVISTRHQERLSRLFHPPREGARDWRPHLWLPRAQM